MNLYKFHDKPESLDHHDKHEHIVPDLVVSHVFEHLKTRAERNAYLRAHKSIFTSNVYLAFRYAEYLGERFPEGEPVLLKHPYYAMLYAKDIIHGPWREAEPIISTSARASYFYADDVLKDRFKEAEATIRNSELWDDYKDRFHLKDDK